MTPEIARARLRRVALSITEASEAEAVARLLEKLACEPDADELRAALVLAGAAAVLNGAATRDRMETAGPADAA